MKKIATALLIAVTALNAAAWSSKGHQVVAYIGKVHLTPTAYQEVNNILEGTSPVYYASWMDQVASSDEYSYTSTWHYLNVDEGQAYEERASLAYTDAVAALYEQTAVLGDPDATREEKEFAIKVIVHVVGDIHQPMHAGHESDKGGNYITVYYNGSRTNLHHLWDYYMVYDAHDWNYYDWQQNIDVLSDEENAELAAGTIDDWARESVALAAEAYAAFPKYAQVTTSDVDDLAPITERQLLKGGLRLAALLNQALDPQTNSVDFDLDLDVDANPIYYNLQGIPVTNPTPGQIYILRKGPRTTKQLYR